MQQQQTQGMEQLHIQQQQPQEQQAMTRGQPLADATNITTTAAAQQASDAKVGQQQQQRPESCTQDHSSSLVRHNAAAPGSPLQQVAVAANPEQLTLMVAAATTAATKAVTQTLLHRRAARQHARHGQSARTSPARHTARAAQQQQQRNMPHDSLTAPGPEQQLLRFADPAAGAAEFSGAAVAGGAGVFSPTPWPSSQSAAAGGAVRDVLQVPIIRFPAAAASAGGAAAAVDAAAVGADGVVCFPRLWTGQGSHPAAGEQHDAAAAAGAEALNLQEPAGTSSAAAAGADSAHSAAAVVDSTACSKHAGEQVSNTGSTAAAATQTSFGVVAVDAPAPAAAAAEPDKQQQQQQAQELRPDKPLPPQLDMAVQRALKTLTDPPPPRPLMAQDLQPATVLLQQQRLVDADR